MSRLVVLAVLALAAIAAADAVRSEPRERTPAGPANTQPPAGRLIGSRPAEYVADGGLTRTRVLRSGREYLSAEEIDAAFPGKLAGVPFDIAHLASAPDGTLALAIWRFPADGSDAAAVELWRGGRLVSAFVVPPGTFGGGLGFTSDGRLVGTISPDGFRVNLFRRDGRTAGRIGATSR